MADESSQADTNEKKLSKKRLEEIHLEAKERFKEINDFEGSERQKMLDDKAFEVGENNKQWDPGDVKSRKISGRSFLTIMRSNQFTDHVKNQQRQNKPSIRISPTDEGANEEEAKRRQGLIRKIQYESKAAQARQAGFDDAVDEGRGHWIVKTQFVPNTFNKEIIIEPIQDSQSVYMDCRRQRPDYSDCTHGFIITHKPRKELEKDYPDINIDPWDGTKDNLWYGKDDVVIAEYYCEMYRKRTLLEVGGLDDNGQESSRTIWEDEIKTDIDRLNIIQKRDEDYAYWMWFKMTGAEIIDYEYLPWKEIPIITVIGKENIVNGQWSCKGLIRDIKAPLRLYNFVSSNEADMIAKAPRIPWIGAQGQFEDNADEWANSNTSDVPYLEYKPVTIGGSLAPPPQRAQYSIDLSNLVLQKQTIIEDIKAITGIYDASIGNRSNETSGVAIKAREAQGNNANFHYIDNFAMAINHEGRVINSAIHVIYDTPRTITTRDDNEEESLLKINTNENDGFSEGNFNLTVSVGPSFNTQREEQAAGMLEMLSVVPLAQNVAADLVVRSQDWIGKDALADRLEFAIENQFPGITTQAKPEKGNEQVVYLQQQLAQCQAKLQQVGQQAQQLNEALEKSGADKNAAAAGQVAIEQAKIQIEVKKLELEAQRLQGEMELEQSKLELEAKKLQQDMLKADLNAETSLKISRDTLEVDLIKTEATNTAKVREIHLTKSMEKESAESLKKIEADKAIEKEPVEIVPEEPKKKTSKVVQTKDGYNVDTRAGNSKTGAVIKRSKITKTSTGYIVETVEA